MMNSFSFHRLTRGIVIAGILAIGVWGTSAWAQGSQSKHNESHPATAQDAQKEGSAAQPDMHGAMKPGMHGDMKNDMHGAMKPDAAGPKAKASAAYPLDTCVVSGLALDANGTPVVETIKDREVRFCSAACAEKFKADPATYSKKLDAAILKAQIDNYPLDTCVVSGQPLDAMDDPIQYVHENRLVQFCCGACIDKFKADPEKFLAKINQAVVEKQMDTYPLDTCVVSGEPLGAMGESIQYVYNNELVQFCCNGCKKQFDKDPAKFMAKLHEAAKGDADAKNTEAAPSGDASDPKPQGSQPKHGDHGSH